MSTPKGHLQIETEFDGKLTMMIGTYRAPPQFWWETLSRRHGLTTREMASELGMPHRTLEGWRGGRPIAAAERPHIHRWLQKLQNIQ